MATKESQLADYLRLSIPGLNMKGSIGAIIRQAIADNWSQNQLQLAVYKSPAFKARFPGIFGPNQELLMSPAAYLAREAELRNVMKDYGLSSFRWNAPTDFGGLINRGIDAQQLAQRLDWSQNLLRKNPEILQQLSASWGISMKDARIGAVTWLLSPNRGNQYFEQLIDSAQMIISARQAGFDTRAMGKTWFEALRGRGITPEQANQAFAQAGGEWSQFKTLAARYGAGKVTDAQFAAALFAPNPQLEAVRKSLISQEQAQFRKTSSYAMAGGRGVSGLQTDEAEDRL